MILEINYADNLSDTFGEIFIILSIYICHEETEGFSPGVLK